MKDTPTKLQLTSTEELINELEDRFDHYIFAGVQEGVSSGDEILREWAGCPIMCKGLSLEIIKFIDEEEEPEYD